MTVAKVIDASAVGAVLFAEPAGAGLLQRLNGISLKAPVLLAYELTNICVKKIRANPEQRFEFLAAFASWTGIGLELHTVEHNDVLMLAEETGLSAYDASYLWLARQLGVELVTLYRQLAAAAARPPTGR